MKFGDILAQDTHLRDIKVGDVVCTYEWYGGSYFRTTGIAMSNTKSGNLRFCYVGTDSGGSVVTSVGWIPKGKGVLYPQGSPCLLNYKSEDNVPLTEYHLNKSEKRFNALMSKLGDKALRNYNLELTWA